jgi:hypothetical protein
MPCKLRRLDAARTRTDGGLEETGVYLFALCAKVPVHRLGGVDAYSGEIPISCMIISERR